MVGANTGITNGEIRDNQIPAHCEIAYDCVVHHRQVGDDDEVEVRGPIEIANPIVLQDGEWRALQGWELIIVGRDGHPAGQAREAIGDDIHVGADGKIGPDGGANLDGAVGGIACIVN